MSNMRIKTGSIVGTGAAINVSLGFVPLFAIVVNMTDNDVLDTYIDGMTATTGIQIGAATAARSSGGLSFYAGDESNPEGLTIGAAVSEAGKTLRYVVIG